MHGVAGNHVVYIHGDEIKPLRQIENWSSGLGVSIYLPPLKSTLKAHVNSSNI